MLLVFPFFTGLGSKHGNYAQEVVLHGLIVALVAAREKEWPLVFFTDCLALVEGIVGNYTNVELSLRSIVHMLAFYCKRYRVDDFWVSRRCTRWVDKLAKLGGRYRWKMSASQ